MESKTKALTVQQRADLALRAGVARLDASHQVASGCMFLSLFHCLGTTNSVLALMRRVYRGGRGDQARITRRIRAKMC